MEDKEMFKYKIVDFWDNHKDDVARGVFYVGCAIIGWKAGKACYNIGYLTGATQVTKCCEKYLPEAHVTSTLTQIAMSQTKK